MLNYRRFLGFAWPYRLRAALGLLSALPANAMDAVIALLMKPFVDNVLTEGSADVAYIPILIILFTLLQSAFKYASGYFLAWASGRISMDVKTALFKRMQRCEPATFDKSTSGQMLIRYSADADAASAGLLGNINEFLTRIVSSISLLCVLFYNSWILAIVAILALGLAVIPMARVKKKLKQFVSEGLVLGMQVTTNYNEAIQGNRTVTSYNLYDYQLEKLDRAQRQGFRIGIKMAQRTGFMSMGMHFAISLGIAATVWLQGYLVQRGMITTGTVASFMVALLMLYRPIKNMGNSFTKVQVSLMAMDRVFEVLDREPTLVDRPGAVEFPKAVCDIVYDNVTFSYEQGKTVLRGVSLKVAAGQTIALVGNSGGGKTTVVNLLPRFYDIDSGAIRINEVNVRDIKMESLRQHIAVVFQDNFLFGGTIRENILLGKFDAGEEDIARAIKAACLDEFIGSLEHGMETQIGERGVKLSGGQKQRVAIARAFLKDAPIVILDEATSALDNQSEAVVQQAIENLMLNKTVFIIAHRLSTVVNADRIVVVRDGEIVETGKHAELVANPNGVYSTLYRTQLV